ncbi:hypothetical protein FXO37_23414 [Capsicum annuum]|nr:hypothetical protein FXO37_23414 [Capsicum annuum]
MDASDINGSLVSELKAMGFSEAQATKALCSSGNSSIEAAVNWIIDHEKDAYTDEMPMVQRSELDNEDSPSLSKLELRRSCCIKPLNCYPTFLWESCKTFTGKGNFKEAISKSKWSHEENAAKDGNHEQTMNGLQEDSALLRRCLVGKFSGGEGASLHSEVRRWAAQTWRGVLNIKVYDVNGFYFLFEFQSRRDAEHMLMGEWRRRPNIES